MKLRVETIEPVEFGDSLSVMPEVDNELKLRLGQLKFQTVEDIDEAIDVISSAFGKYSAEVKTFLVKNNVGLQGLVQLQTYLAGGADALKMYRNQIEKMVDKQVETAIAAMGESNG